ncbi:DNA topoisomerase IB [Arthrobacter sp. 35W]|uniref:DNA topoisomerase IB n=1 Tax=Arthrobacter sp. 35W TaxID=1132441 RepID=UPI00041EDAE9|nr:DNA topoisomerase IB [Arthrobacter sp. 35W]
MQRLQQSDPDGPGISRRRAGRGFIYLTPSNRPVAPKEKLRITALAIPPAWRNVWICPRPNGHIQATGTDDAGRRQYIYHQAWTEAQAKEKFIRAAELGARLPQVRRRVARHLRESTSPRTRTLAAALRLMDLGALRIGSEEYAAENGSFGLSTLESRHASVSGTEVHLSFPGKSGQPWDLRLDDKLLADFLKPLAAQSGRSALLAYKVGEAWQSVDAQAVNEYISRVAGAGCSAKDFRTWKGTMTAAAELARTGGAPTGEAVSAAIVVAAEVLGNTVAVARGSYVDPRLLDIYLKGGLAGVRPTDAAVSRLLGGAVGA